MYTDKCSIQNITRDEQFGVETITDTITPDCRVEQNDTSKNSTAGTRVNYQRLYILPPGTNVTAGDKIKTTFQRGVTVTEEYKEIDEAFPIGAFTPHHIEVYIY